MTDNDEFSNISDASENNIKFPKYMDVYVKNINMSFINMVMFMVKWALASIPAIIILIFIGYFLLIFFGVTIETLITLITEEINNM